MRLTPETLRGIGLALAEISKLHDELLAEQEQITPQIFSRRNVRRAREIVSFGHLLVELSMRICNLGKP